MLFILFSFTVLVSNPPSKLMDLFGNVDDVKSLLTILRLHGFEAIAEPKPCE